jgi:hypothetical protein
MPLADWKSIVIVDPRSSKLVQMSQAAISSAMTGNSQNGEIRRLVFILASVCEAGVS